MIKRKTKRLSQNVHKLHFHNHGNLSRYRKMCSKTLLVNHPKCDHRAARVCLNELKNYSLKYTHHPDLGELHPYSNDVHLYLNY